MWTVLAELWTAGLFVRFFSVYSVLLHYRYNNLVSLNKMAILRYACIVMSVDVDSFVRSNFGVDSLRYRRSLYDNLTFPCLTLKCTFQRAFCCHKLISIAFRSVSLISWPDCFLARKRWNRTYLTLSLLFRYFSCYSW